MSEFVQMDREVRLFARLKQHGVKEPQGLTTTESRRDTLRAEITGRGLAETIFGRAKDGKPLTYREAFAVTYGESL